MTDSINEQKYILITGAGSGIGRATARLFAARGWFVGLADINAASVAETAAMIDERLRTTFVFDVRARADWTRAARAFSDLSGGRLDVLFNNAGIAHGGWFEDVSPEDAEATIDVNLKGALNGIYTCLPLLKQTPGARIINTASVAGLVGAPRMAAYTASKFAVRGLSEALDLEFSRFGVRVVCLAPWFTDTPILDAPISGADGRAPRHNLTAGKVAIYPPELAAARAWDAAHGDAQLYVAGREAARAHWAQRLLPGLVRARLRKLLVER